MNDGDAGAAHMLARMHSEVPLSVRPRLFAAPVARRGAGRY